MIKESIFKKKIKIIALSKGIQELDEKVMAVYFNCLKALPYIEEVMDNAVFKKYRGRLPEVAELNDDHKELASLKRQQQENQERIAQHREAMLYENRRNGAEGHTHIFDIIRKTHFTKEITREESDARFDAIIKGVSNGI